jgi:hypothetical protein
MDAGEEGELRSDTFYSRWAESPSKPIHLYMLRNRDILFAVAEFLGTGSHVPLLLVIDAI